jgi:uncharacterized protein YyaL (SSP411 family)
MLAALIDLYEATGQERWFSEAVALADSTWERFGDPESGGFFSTPTDGEKLAVRRKDIEDRPVPSGNATMALALMRLHALTGDGRHLDRAEGVMRILGPLVERLPLALGRMLLALQIRADGIDEVAIVGPAPEGFLTAVRSKLRRNVVVAVAPAASSSVPLLAGREPIGDQTLAWLCRGFACQMPADSPDQLAGQLDGHASAG